MKKEKIEVLEAKLLVERRVVVRHGTLKRQMQMDCKFEANFYSLQFQKRVHKLDVVRHLGGALSEKSRN